MARPLHSFLIVLTGVAISAIGEAAPDPVDDVPEAVQSSFDASHSDLIDRLDAHDFDVRVAATRALQDVSTAAIPQLAELAHSHPSAEVSARLLEFLEQKYVSSDQAAVQAASDALEALTGAPRLLVAESAQESLDRNWQIRVDLATAELVRMGAILLRDSASTNAQIGAGVFNWQVRLSRDDLKVLLTDEYRGGSEGLKQFERMVAMTGPASMLPGLGVYAIDGNTLSEEDITRLQNLVGAGRYAARGRVVLGITGRPSVVSGYDGCLLLSVTPNSSAATAGLRRGDLITALEGKPLRDFDDLVDRLKAFDVGDSVDATVIRQFEERLTRRVFGPHHERSPEPPQPEQVVVTLKGWAEFAREVAEQNRLSDEMTPATPTEPQPDADLPEGPGK